MVTEAMILAAGAMVPLLNRDRVDVWIFWICVSVGWWLSTFDIGRALTADLIFLLDTMETGQAMQLLRLYFQKQWLGKVGLARDQVDDAF